jgi:hypothetical protein
MSARRPLRDSQLPIKVLQGRTVAGLLSVPITRCRALEASSLEASTTR